MSEDNSDETDTRNHWSEWRTVNDVPMKLYYEDYFFVAKPTDRNFLVTIPLDGLDGQSG